MPIAKDRNYEREREFIDAMSLDAKIRMFLSRYAPHPGHNFEADLIQIVQCVYREAQAPFVKASAEAMARAPMPPIFFDRK